MTDREKILTIRSDQDQDEAHCADWWAQASEEDRLAVWDRIVAMGGPADPAGEMVARFAQLAVSRCFLEHQARNPGPRKGE